jgi:thioester reductase-like protein
MTRRITAALPPAVGPAGPFAPRREDQVQLIVRGTRMDAAAIERDLSVLPGVRSVTVLALGEGERAALVAAVVAGDGFDPGLARALARRTLPAELLPDRFVAIDSAPLAANGKTDRAALARMLEPPAAATRAGGGRPAENEQALTALWSDVVGREPSSPEASFFDLGGTSLNAHQLAVRIRERFGLCLSVRDLMLAPTLGAQARLVAGKSGSAYDAVTVEDRMVEDSRLPDWFRPGRRTARSAPEHILLTGASGFVGTHLLAELLRTSGVTVTCLVNAADEQAGRTRLDRRAQRYRLEAPGECARLRVLRGDLSAERFGLDPAAFDRLAAEVDTIVHTGAEVNLVRPYQRLRATNVLGTREVLRLAATGPLSAIHHVSALGILPRRGGRFDEFAFPAREAVPAQGYGQTKWAAEAMLRAARREGVPVSVYRLGEVMPHSGTGVFSHSGSLSEFILEACVELGVQVATGVSSDLTPVDNVCRFIAAAALEGDPGDCFHVAQPEPARLDELIAQFGRAFALAPVDYPEFRARVAHRARRAPGYGVFARLLAVLPDSSAVGDLRALFPPPPVAGSTERCRRLSDRLGVRWVPAGAEVFQRYAQSFSMDW